MVTLKISNRFFFWVVLLELLLSNRFILSPIHSWMIPTLLKLPTTTTTTTTTTITPPLPLIQKQLMCRSPRSFSFLLFFQKFHQQPSSYDCNNNNKNSNNNNNNRQQKQQQQQHQQQPKQQQGIVRTTTATTTTAVSAALHERFTTSRRELFKKTSSNSLLLFCSAKDHHPNQDQQGKQEQKQQQKQQHQHQPPPNDGTATTITTTTVTPIDQVLSLIEKVNSKDFPIPVDNSNQYQIMKAWTCHGTNQKELVNRLIHAGIIKSKPVQQVMYDIDRQYYIRGGKGDTTTTTEVDTSGTTTTTNNDNTDYYCSYQDAPQTIGYGQTISAPHMHAHALEEILPYVLRFRTTTPPPPPTTTTSTTTPTTDTPVSPPPITTIKILDVGCGSGYLTACFGRWFQPRPVVPTTTTTTTTTSTSTSPDQKLQVEEPILHGLRGEVYGIDIVDHLVQFAKENIMKNDSDLLFVQEEKNDEPLELQLQLQSLQDENEKGKNKKDEKGNVHLFVSNGWYGLQKISPFHVIHVGAAAETFPRHLLTQLVVGGIMIIPIGPIHGPQVLYKIIRIKDNSSSSNSNSSSNSSHQNQNATTTTTTTTQLYFDPNEYQVTELLGVRYVPLVQRPQSNN